jgi:hypothetical protein
LERERASLEEVRRRQAEYQTGREEMVQSLTRALGLLEEAEFSARRDAEQMSRSLGELREALQKVQALSEDHWRPDNFNEELTRALTTIENARMEYNSARLKFPVLAANPSPVSAATAPPAPENPFGARTFGELCRLGFAITWPIAFVLAIVAVLLLVLVLKR